MPGRSFDVVLCRNVLIYLTGDAIRRATATLHGALAPGGWLLMGASDPPLDHPGLDVVRTEHGIVYRRTEGAREPHEPAVRASRPDVASEATRRPVSTPRRRPNPSPPAARPAAPSTTGRSDDSDPMDATARCITAARHLEAGRVQDAITEANAAVYLEPTLVAAQVLLGHAAEHTGDQLAAARGYRNALTLLGDFHPDVEVELLGEPAGLLAHGILDRLRRIGLES